MSHDKIYFSILEILPGCIKSGDVSPFASILEGKISEPMKVCVETAVRFYVMETLCTGTNTDLGQITVVCKKNTPTSALQSIGCWMQHNTPNKTNFSCQNHSSHE
ncbi:hypothetical protein FHG87_024818 [Trinorchestia longiramus]|nr:hypothetical protein FHG87_024818 [Trinorchestia longiramus]